MKKLLLYILISVLYILPATADDGSTASIEGKWQPYDITISIEGIPSAISTAIAQQMKNDPSSECVKNSIIEVKASGSYTLSNACEENANLSGTWKLTGDKLAITLSNQPNLKETIVIKAITADTITVDITDKIPSDFEFNGIKVSSVQLVLKRM